MVIGIEWKGGEKSNTHTKKSPFSGEKAKIATTALKVARLVICIITLPLLLGSSNSVPKEHAIWEGELCTFSVISFLRKKKKPKQKPNQSHRAHPIPLMERWLQVVDSEFQKEFPAERAVCRGPMKVLLWDFGPWSLAAWGEGGAGADARPEGCQGVPGGC